jgi:amino acid adenylation domain-containing protein
LAVQYADFALWQRQTMANEAAYTNQIEFWRKQLGGTLPVLALPADKPRPTFQSFKGSNVFLNIPKALAQDLRSLGAREGCTFFMTLLAAFQVLLQRYSGTEDIIIGTPVAARTPREVEPLIGIFINMVALRCDLSGNPTFIELLRRSRDTTLDAFSNSDLPFEAMMKHLKFERDPSRNPIYQVLLQVLSTAAPRIGDLEISSFHFDLKFAQFDLSLDLYEEAGGYSGRFEYCSDLFEAQTIRRLCGHYGTLLEAIVRDPDRSISMLPLLTESERRQVLVEWNDTDADYPADALLHQLFEAQARRTPEAVAVVSEGRMLSYRELECRANQLAHALRKRGVGTDVLVGLCVNRTADMIVALLGILKAGGAYVPLDPDYPADRLAFMLKDCGAKVLIAEESLQTSIPPLPPGCDVLYLDRDAAAIATERQDAPRSEVDLSHLAYAIYTSGSTGLPKAALLNHHGLLNLAVSEKQLYGVGPHSRVLQFASLSFDASLSEIAMALCSGATLYVEGRDTILPGPELERYLQQERITVLVLTPSALAVLDPTAVPSVEQVIVGGETCPAELAERWAGRCRFFNTYGPTEATVVTTYVEYRDGALPPNIGRPLPNVRVYLLDQALDPVPVGVAGELYIGGIGVARGYLNRPQLNAERFLPDPFRDTPGALMYRSGDYARWRSDGQIEFIGRVDDQVKIRGFRIELGEIEAALARHPQVQACAVIVREDTPGERRLVAYLVPRGGDAPTVGALREHLKRSLPDYMVPAAFVVMEALPLTPNDKVDRKALQAPGENDVVPRVAAVAPRTATEQMVISVFRDVLERDSFGVFDNFFDLGGHSLMAARLMSKLRADSGVDLPFRNLFERPTVAGLAEAIDALSWSMKSKTSTDGAFNREEMEL